MTLLPYKQVCPSLASLASLAGDGCHPGQDLTSFPTGPRAWLVPIGVHIPQVRAYLSSKHVHDQLPTPISAARAGE